MANPEHLAKLLESVGAWNDWRKANTGVVPDLNGADLRGADLAGANLNGVNLRGADFIWADLHSASLIGACLGLAILRVANLVEADLRRADLRGADLDGALLNGANLTEANLSNAKLTGADFTGADSEHLAKLKEGAEAWNNWRKANPEIVPDLHNANLVGANVVGANLYAANLQRASLAGANLNGADLRRAKLALADLRAADLHGADLGWATLTGTQLGEADLRSAGLRGADLYGALLNGAYLGEANLSNANLVGANLIGADLTRARICFTAFGDNDLSDVRGLETVHHDGPSTIGIDTIYRSQGKIPLAFLRGAGVPDNFIEYMGSLTGKALEFYSCFISYSTKDQEFADRLYADLQNKGVRCWFAPHDIQAGKKIHEQIEEAIRRYERLLLILSPNSMNSEWVKTEIRKARKRERTEKKRVLFPVRLVSFEAIRDWELFDADEGKDLAVEIREYFIPDFSDWK